MAARHVEGRGNGVLVCLGESCLEYIAHTDGYPKRETDQPNACARTHTRRRGGPVLRRASHSHRLHPFLLIHARCDGYAQRTHETTATTRISAAVARLPTRPWRLHGSRLGAASRLAS